MPTYQSGPAGLNNIRTKENEKGTYQLSPPTIAVLAIIQVLILTESAIQNAAKFQAFHSLRSGSTGTKSGFVRSACAWEISGPGAPGTWRRWRRWDREEEAMLSGRDGDGKDSGLGARGSGLGARKWWGRLKRGRGEAGKRGRRVKTRRVARKEEHSGKGDETRSEGKRARTMNNTTQSPIWML